MYRSRVRQLTELNIMSFSILIVIDLCKVSDIQQTLFYEKLKQLTWSNIEPCNRTWECDFKDNVSLYNAYKLILQDLNKAKEHSKVSDFKYKIQTERISLMKGVI